MSALDGLPLSAEMRPDLDQYDLNDNDGSTTYRERDAKVGGTINEYNDHSTFDQWRVAADYMDGDADDSDDNPNAAPWSVSGVLSQSSLAS